MNDKERIVLWMGLILIGLNLAANWKQIRDIIFTGSSGTVPTTPGSTTPAPSLNPLSPGFRWPSLPGWIPHIPGTTIPLVSYTTPTPNSNPTQQTSSTTVKTV
jgi:hypothetical protein